jgi:hypothetical protein
MATLLLASVANLGSAVSSQWSRDDRVDQICPAGFVAACLYLIVTLTLCVGRGLGPGSAQTPVLPKHGNQPVPWLYLLVRSHLWLGGLIRVAAWDPRRHSNQSIT